MKYSEHHHDGNLTILALILTLVLASIYYSPELFTKYSLGEKSFPVETTNYSGE